jgi:tetratricopeptide (TPR) repeat protein
VARVGDEWHAATVEWVDAKGDVAILSCHELSANGAVRWGRLVGSAPLPWGAVGFPVASVDDARARHPEHAYGLTSPISDVDLGRLALTVGSREAIGADPPIGNYSPWAGLSGAAVFCGDHLVGVVTTDPGSYARSLVGRRVEDFCHDPGLKDLLGSLPELEDVEGTVPISSQPELRTPERHKVLLGYLKADVTWAEWIDALLTQVGFRVVRKGWFFDSSENLASRANQTVNDNEFVIVLLSAAFNASPHSNVGLSHLMADGRDHRRILLVRAERCELPDWLAERVSVDFVEQPPESAAAQILDELEVRGFRIGKGLDSDARSALRERNYPGWGPQITNLPPRNNIFTDRLEALKRIQQVLLGEDNAGKLQKCAIHGLGGTGKTETVLEFAHRFGSHYDLVWWIRAEEHVSISDHLLALAGMLQIEQTAAQSNILIALWQELRRRDRWLLIFDNALNPVALKSFWPPAGSGDVLVTSQNPTWTSVGASLVPVKPFARADSVTFLQKRSNRTGEHKEALAIAETLGDLPLALEQAAAYVDKTRGSFESYADLLQENMEALLEAGEAGTVAWTFETSINKARAEQPHARDLLALLAHFAPDDIPRELVPGQSLALRGPLANAVTSPVRYDQILAALVGFSLVDAYTDRIEIHRLVRRAVRDGLDPSERVSFYSDAVRLLEAAFPADPLDMQTWPTCGRLLVHVAWIMPDHERLGPLLSSQLGSLLQRSGRYLHARGDYAQGRRFLELALEKRRGRVGRERLAEAETLTSLGRVYYHLAVLDQARQVTEQAMDIYREELGDDSPQAAENMLHLSRILRESGEFLEAESIARGFLRECGRMESSDPGLFAAGHSTLGDALWRLGRPVDARASYLEALSIRHGSIASSPADLASCHKHIGIISIELGDNGTAEEELRNARDLLRGVFDEDSLDVMDVDLHLGDVLCRTNRPEEAVAILRHVVRVREETLGDHPDLAGALVKLGVALTALRNYPEAISMLRRASAMFAERSRGNPRYVADAELALAETFRDAGELKAARTAGDRSLAIYKEMLGTDHQSTVQAQAFLEELQGAPRPATTCPNAGL